MSNEPKFPNIPVQLVGEDGNAFFIIGRVMTAMKKHGVSHDLREEFRKDAMSGDYDHVLQTCMKWVAVS